MTDPYRDGGGTPCVRCGVALRPDELGDLICIDGCGTWIDQTAIEDLYGKRAQPVGGRVQFWKATPLPATRCLVCRGPLEDLYAQHGDEILAIGRCAEHGVWIERGGRADLFEAFRGERAAPKSSRARPRPEAPVPPATLAEAAARIVELEERVAYLEKLLPPLARRR